MTVLALRTVYAHWHSSTVLQVRIGMATFSFFSPPFQNSLHRSSLNKETPWLLCCLIQAITRANSESDSVPGEGKIYILGWNMKIILLMRAVHDKNQIINKYYKAKGMEWCKCRRLVAKATCTEVKYPKLLCDYAKALTIELID